MHEDASVGQLPTHGRQLSIGFLLVLSQVHDALQQLLVRVDELLEDVLSGYRASSTTGGVLVLALRGFGVPADDEREQVLPAHHEEFVFELQVLAVLLGYFLEAIGVELSDKGTDVPVLEVRGQHLLLKHIRLLNYERVATWTPADDGFEFIIG